MTSDISGSRPNVQSVSDEIRELLALTEQCVAHARVAKQQAQRYAAHFKVNSEEFRKLAARSPFPGIQARLLRIATANERLCNIAEGDVPPPKPVTSVHVATVRRSEDPVSQARRHVAEAEARVERQEALAAKLSDSGKNPQLAGQAREILGTLKQTLRLARDHLALELSK